MEQVTQYMTQIVAAVGMSNIIIIAIILIALIVAIVIYRSLRLKVARQDIVEIENHINGIKTLPIQYRLGRVESIAKNMPEVAEQYKTFSADYERLKKFQKDEVDVLMNDVDEQLFYGRLRGANKKLNELRAMADSYDKDSKDLLARIEKVTEIENEQRIEIIRVKEKYRGVQNEYETIRAKVESYVPEIRDIFQSIDDDFVRLEGLMNNQMFADARTFTKEIEDKIDRLGENMKELPSYVSVVRQLLPTRIHEIESIANDLSDDTYALDKLLVEDRYNEIVDELEESQKLVKAVRIEEAGEKLNTLTDHIESLTADLSAERESYRRFTRNWEECKSLYDEAYDQYAKAMEDFTKLKVYYKIDAETVTIENDYHEYNILYDTYRELEDDIMSGDFSYADVSQRIENLVEGLKPHADLIEKFNTQRDSFYEQEQEAIEVLENINIVLLETKSEIKNRHLPMINDSYKDYIKDSYRKAEDIQEFRSVRPVDLEELTRKVEGAKDVIYKLYDNVHNLTVTAEMVEEAIVFGNRYRSQFLEVNTELTKAEVLFRNGEYTDALSLAIDIIEKVKPGSYEELLHRSARKAA